MRSIFRISLFSAAAAALSLSPAAQASDGIATPWQLGFQPAATPVMENLASLHDHFLLWVIAAITAFVLLLTLFIMVRFRRSANPVPSKTSHNTLVEIIWTVVPILILVAIAIPSLRTHYFMKKTPEAEMTLKVVGHQWYWSYEYPDQGGFGFDSYMVKDEDLKPGQHRLLEVDNRIVVPVDTVVRVQGTSADVIHAWAVPAFGVKKDVVPGRLNETWFKATRTGVFYGQCSELCGVGHGFMPIAVEVVSKDQFAQWVAARQKEAGIAPAQSNATTSPLPQQAVPQPNAVPEAVAAPTPLSGGVPNVGATETNTQPDRQADAPAKKDAASDIPGTATPPATPAHP